MNNKLTNLSIKTHNLNQWLKLFNEHSASFFTYIEDDYLSDKKIVNSEKELLKVF